MPWKEVLTMKANLLALAVILLAAAVFLSFRTVGTPTEPASLPSMEGATVGKVALGQTREVVEATYPPPRKESRRGSPYRDFKLPNGLQTTFEGIFDPQVAYDGRNRVIAVEGRYLAFSDGNKIERWPVAEVVKFLGPPSEDSYLERPALVYPHLGVIFWITVNEKTEVLQMYSVLLTEPWE